MISMEAHVYAFYLYQTKGNMQRAADERGVDRKTFHKRCVMYRLDFRDFRGPMCQCRRKGNRCEVCLRRNRDAAKRTYYERKNNPNVCFGITSVTPLRVFRMMALSDQMATMQRFLKLSK
jgi:hypothetical protein